LQGAGGTPSNLWTELNFRSTVNLTMATRKRPGRPTIVDKPADLLRYIPLIMRHGDVLKLDRASAAAGLSRAEWVRRKLLAAASRAA
jgi:hypothetical protein